MIQFKLGDTVVWTHENFHPAFWDKLTESDRVKYYGDLGYGCEKQKLFTFICEHNPQVGHCTLVEIGTVRVETMRHTSEFRLATDDEC